MTTVAEDAVSVLFSSHAVAELERIADYLVVLNGGRLQLAGEVERLLAGHTILTGPGGEMFVDSQQDAVVHATRAGLGAPAGQDRGRGRSGPPRLAVAPGQAGGPRAWLPARTRASVLPGPAVPA